MIKELCSLFVLLWKDKNLWSSCYMRFLITAAAISLILDRAIHLETVNVAAGYSRPGKLFDVSYH